MNAVLAISLEVAEAGASKHREREILEDWNAKGVNSDFNDGNLTSFLKRASRFAYG